VRDCLADHAQACYGVNIGKSMKARCDQYNRAYLTTWLTTVDVLAADLLSPLYFALMA
jgi:hypothetical protein